MQIKFSKSNDLYTFSDALNLPDDHTFTDEEIELMKQQRFDNWLTVIHTPSEIEPIPEEDPNSLVDATPPIEPA